MLKNRLLVVSFALLSAVGTIAAPAPAEEVSLSYTASTLTFLAAKVALDQNFFRQEGLDVSSFSDDLRGKTFALNTVD